MNKSEEIPEKHIFDSHAHLLDERIISSPDLLDGIGGIICFSEPGENISAFKDFLKNDKIWGACGIHPHNADGYLKRKEELIQTLSLKKVRLLGEIGLDYYWDNSPRAVQRKVFEEQLMLASDLKMPVSVHSRDAFRDTMDILKNYQNIPVLIHCFSEGPAEASEAVERGYYIAFGGTVTFPKAEELRKAALEVPEERMLVETDSPYLAPQPVRGKVNRPSYARYTIEALAELKKRTAQETAFYTYKAALDYLGLNYLR